MYERCERNEGVYSRVMGMNVKRMLYAGVAVPTALYGPETLIMAIREMKKLNVMEIRYLSMCGVTCMDRVKNDYVQRITGATRDLTVQS